ncbi:MAG: HDOD domain-containing protein [Rhodocyclaceae bacterium]|nr:HDOD domain-containing protein [Rhodocyclaceae bacterium]
MITLDLDALPPLSPLAIEMLALRIEDDDAERKLIRILSSEPQLAARIIAMANSAAFGLSRLQFATVPLALRRICLRRALQLCTGALFGHPVSERLAPRTRLQLWLHALAMATAASELARIKHLPHAEEAYLAGLLHDLGYMLAELESAGIIESIAHRAADNGLSMEAAEVEILGSEHGEVTALLLTHWGVPDPYCAMFRRHHATPSDPRSIQAILFSAEKLVRLDVFADELFGDRDHLFADALLPLEGVGGHLLQEMQVDAHELSRIVDRVLGQVATISGLATEMAAA